MRDEKLKGCQKLTKKAQLLYNKCITKLEK